MAYNNFSGFNPLQNRMESLMQQRQMIDQQMQSLQNMNVPPININNNMTPTTPDLNFDFNGVWVTGKDQAKGLAKGNKPLVMFDNNNPIFYMSTPAGDFKEYRFEEVIPTEETHSMVDDRINNLENKLDSLINALGGDNKPSEVTTPKTTKTSPKAKKEG